MQLYILDYGLFQVHENGRIIGIPGYLIRLETGQNILVDTGFPAWYVADPAGAARRDGLDSFGWILQLSPDNLPAGQLARLGLAPADITHLIMTHTHIDHVGGLGDFPNAIIIIGAAERACPQPLYWADIHPIPWPETATYLVIDQDTELHPGLTLLTTPGHSPGHLSLLIRLPHTGPVLLTADAISRPEEVEQDRFGGAWNEAQTRASAHQLMQLARQEQAWVIYGHDPAQWGTLRKAPEFYD
jgi:N-acyl homoserine lactone hydrolase